MWGRVYFTLWLFSFRTCWLEAAEVKLSNQNQVSRQRGRLCGLQSCRPISGFKSLTRSSFTIRYEYKYIVTRWQHRQWARMGTSLRLVTAQARQLTSAPWIILSLTFLRTVRALQTILLARMPKLNFIEQIAKMFSFSSNRKIISTSRNYIVKVPDCRIAPRHGGVFSRVICAWSVSRPVAPFRI